MKKLFFVIAVYLIPVLTNAQLIKKTGVQLVIEEEGGANSCSVIWLPKYKKYYTSMIGNASFPFAVFNEKGKLVTTEGMYAGEDLRGMWYNENSKRLEFNCYDSSGYGHFDIDTKTGIPGQSNIDIEGMLQPDNQAVATYDKVTNSLMFFNYAEFSVENYSLKTGYLNKTITKIHFGCQKIVPEDFDYYAESEDRNLSSVQLTGIAKSELAFVNVKNHTIELYNKKTGFMTKELKIPETQVVYDIFNFCYNNGLYWFFDKNKRTWTAYK